MALTRIAMMSFVLSYAACSPITQTQQNVSRTTRSTDYRLNGIFAPDTYVVELKLADGFESSKEFEMVNTEIVVDYRKDQVVDEVGEMEIHYNLKTVENIVVEVTDKDGAILPATFHPPRVEGTEIYTIRLEDDKVFPKDGAPFTVKFQNLIGKLQDEMHGFYLSTYEVDGKPEYIATTQLHPTHARSVFPCFDEPEYKALFQISITKPEEYTTTIANTYQVGDAVNLGDGLEKVVFAETPPMSTYIIAFVVSKFKFAGTLPEQRRIYYPKGSESAAQYAFDITPSILSALQDYTDLKYDDLDNKQLYQIAVPDFSWGAMENWGLVTYRETALLWDPNEATFSSKQRVTSVIAHELSHMWFGNYVTLKWWSDTWLNEGFATYFEYLITDKVEPSWEIMEQFVFEKLQNVFNIDAVYPGRPLSTPSELVNTVDDINAVFGTISYDKGGSIVRMMEHALPEGILVKSLRTYLTENKHQNVIPGDLMEAMKSNGVSGAAAIMKEWVEQPGYPVIHVSRNTASSSSALLTQQPFALNEPTLDTRWWVPLSYATAAINSDFSNTRPTWFDPEWDIINIQNAFENSDWVVFNVQQTGYYRVDYEKSLWQAITKALRRNGFSGIHRVNRAQLVDDVMAMARVTRQDYGTAMDLTKYLEKETDYLPWASSFKALGFLRKRFGATSETGKLLQEYILKISNQLYESVSFNIPVATKQTDVLKTTLSLQWACELGEEECIAESKRMFAAFKTDPTAKVDPNVRSVVYCNGIRHGDRTDYDFLWNQFKNEKLATEQVLILNALGCTRDGDTLKEYLQESINPESPVRRQDKYTMFTGALAGDHANVEIVFDFLKNNHQAIKDNYFGMNSLSKVVTALADQLTTTTQVDEFSKFVEENRPALGEAAPDADVAVATAQANIAWVRSNQNSLNDWLKRESGAAGLTVSISLLAVAIIAHFFNN